MSKKREDFSFTSPDGFAIACYRWPAAGRAAAAIQIAHGLGEHSIRYARAAGFLNRAGYVAAPGTADSGFKISNRFSFETRNRL